MKRLNKKSKNSGQAVIAVVLIMVVALTIGLAISSRSVTDVKMSRQMEESQRAFSAAEAGIESALYSGVEGGAQVGNASYQVNFKDTGGAEFVFPKTIPHDEFYQITLAQPGSLDTPFYDHNFIKVAWGNLNPNWPTDAQTPAIEVIELYKDNNVYRLNKYALDPRDRGNGFCQPPGQIGKPCIGVTPGSFLTTAEEEFENINNQKLQFSAILSLHNDRPNNIFPQALRVRLLYNGDKDNEKKDKPQYFGVKGINSAIPSQGRLIESTGSSGGTTRKVQVYELNEALPESFDYSLFTVGDIIK